MTTTDDRIARYDLYAWQRAVAAGETRDSYDTWRTAVLDWTAPEVPIVAPVTDGVLTVTFDYESWEFFYEFLAKVVVERGLIVRLNDVTVEVIGMDAGWLDGQGSLRYQPETDDGSGAATTRALPLFADDGNVTIHSVHVL